jgi:riboflavin kinase / FMN adenylyltransferase
VTNQAGSAIEVLAALPQVPHVATVGNFDGVHRGHQFLISQVIDDATRRGARSLVVTFEPHPTSVLRPDVRFERLTSADEKLDFIRQTGVDDIAIIPFTTEFASLTADEFLGVLSDGARTAAVFVGEGFRFGRNRSGDGETIRAFGDQRGFETTIVTRLRDGEQIVSSSAIRDALKRGDIATANHWLGRRFRLHGTVQHGAARGRELGFPTANLLFLEPICLPCDGIYAAYARVPEADSRAYQAMVYIGTRPTFDGGDRIVEANLLDFSGDLYTLNLEIEFVEFVRSDALFTSAEALAAQMGEDEDATREILESQTPSFAARLGKR